MLSAQLLTFVQFFLSVLVYRVFSPSLFRLISFSSRARESSHRPVLPPRKNSYFSLSCVSQSRGVPIDHGSFRCDLASRLSLISQPSGSLRKGLLSPSFSFSLCLRKDCPAFGPLFLCYTPVSDAPLPDDARPSLVFLQRVMPGPFSLDVRYPMRFFPIETRLSPRFAIQTIQFFPFFSCDASLAVLRCRSGGRESLKEAAALPPFFRSPPPLSFLLDH